MFCAPGHFFGCAECVRSRFHVLRSRTCFRRIGVASGPVFFVSGLIFDGTECVRSRFHVLLSRTRFRRYLGRPIPFSCFCSRTCFWRCGGRPIPFSCFELSDTFSTEPRTSTPIFIFCVPELVSRGTEGVVSRFHVLISRTHFRRNRGCRVPFTCFALPELFSAVLRALGVIFMFCALGHVFCGTEGVGSRFHVLRSQTHFRR
jgi:hypothetical protein